MDLKMYLPNVKFFVGVIIVLIVVSFLLKTFSGTPLMAKVRGYVGLVPSSV